jgi:polysaccharide biosynthesis/export protein
MKLVVLMVMFSWCIQLTTPAQNGTTDPARDAPPAFSPSSSTVGSTNSMDALDSKRKLSIGDRLGYRVVEERTEARPLTVTDSGEVDVPLIGRVGAAGKTCQGLAREIKRALEKDYFYTATVIIGLDAASSKSRGYIYVMGAVKSQGAIEIPQSGDFTVSKAIMRAGGFADFANRRKVRLIRKGKEMSDNIAIDVNAILEGNASKDPVLQEDDVIIIAENRINF